MSIITKIKKRTYSSSPSITQRMTYLEALNVALLRLPDVRGVVAHERNAECSVTTDMEAIRSARMRVVSSTPRVFRRQWSASSSLETAFLTA